MLSVQCELVSTWRGSPLAGIASDSQVLPLGERSHTALFKGLAINGMAFLAEVVVKTGVNRGELL